MQLLEVSGAVRLIYGSLGVKRLTKLRRLRETVGLLNVVTHMTGAVYWIRARD